MSSTAISHLGVSHPDHSHSEAMPSAMGLPSVKLCMWLFLISEVMFFAGLIGAYIVIRFGTAGWPNPYDILAVRITAFNTFLLICSSVTMVKAFQWSDAGDRGRAMKFLAATIVIGAGFVGIQLYEYTHLLHPPSHAMLEHVEARMAERGLDVENGAAHASISRPHILLASMGQDAEEHKNEELAKLHDLLAEGRPQVKKTAAPSKLAVVHDWDKRVLEQTIVVASLFPDDVELRKLGKHQNLYPEGFIPSRDNFTSTFYIMTGFHGFHVFGGVVALCAIFSLYAVGKAGTMSLEVIGLYWHFVDLVWIILFTIVYLM